jgi:hypothetical protein
MTGKEIITRVLDYASPPRIGYSFNRPHPSDIDVCWNALSPLYTPDDEYGEWGRYPELARLVPDFTEDLRRSNGNIYGRIFKTKGECIRGFLEDGWDRLDEYIALYVDPLRRRETYAPDTVSRWAEEHRDQFTMAPVISLQALARDARRFENMLADTLLEPENLGRLVNACADTALFQIDLIHEFRFDSAIIYDDWGLQNTLAINPESWREIWKPAYAKVIDRLHNRGMKFFLHSCGYNRAIIGDLVEIGVDALQFDQPCLYDFDTLSGQISGKTSLWSPVDIQKVLPSGDKEKIQAEARRMLAAFFRHGGFIAKDYPSLDDIGVKDEWAQYARDIFTGSGGFA